MSTVTGANEINILRRVVEADDEPLSVDSARAILRLGFGKADRSRINKLAAKNRAGKITAAEDEEFENYLRVGRMLAILQSKARQAMKAAGVPVPRKSRKP